MGAHPRAYGEMDIMRDFESLVPGSNPGRRANVGGKMKKDIILIVGISLLIIVRRNSFNKLFAR